MSEQSVASRYAKSILDLSIEQNNLPKVFQDIQDFIQTCKTSPELIALLRNPIIQPGKKLSIVKAIFEGKFQPLTLSFFEIMIKKERAEVLYPSAKEFIWLYNIKKEIVVADITTAIELTPELEKQIMAKVHELYKGEVQVKKVIDPDIIGGFILRVEDKQFDSSLRKKLSDLKKELINTSFIKQF